MKKTTIFLLVITFISIVTLSCIKIPSQSIILNPPIKKVISEIKKESSTVKSNPTKIEKKEDVSHKKLSWGIGLNKDESEPYIPDLWKVILNKFNGYYIGPTINKKVFLTFDCGYEAGYTSQIIDTLKLNKVPAIFFITGQYIEAEPGLVKKMAEKGFQIGNHTMRHPPLPTLTEKQIQQEVNDLTIKMNTLLGKKPIYFRPPNGLFSEFSLGIIKDLGFKTIFWSLAYQDWIPLPGGAEESYQTVMKRIHPGAIILMHAVSKDNRDALQRIIDSIRAKGYEFGSIDF